MQRARPQGSRHPGRSRGHAGGNDTMQIGILFDKLDVDLYALT
jgi:hypothetical protein